MITLIIAVCCLIVGMSCPFLAFIVFKPVLKMYIDAISLNKRLTEDSVAERVMNRIQGIPVIHEKAPKKTVFRPKRDTDEGE